MRHLRPVQVYGRIWFRLYRPSIDLSPTPPVRPVSGVWQIPAARKPSLLHPRVFRFLNEEYALVDPRDWDDPAVDKLWRYNLHYFDDLNAEDAESRYDWHKTLLSRWVFENKPGRGTGWEPYPTSLRIVNWIKWVLAGNDLPSECEHSLAVQTRWLSKRIEYHLLGNHLWANAKALVFAGVFYEGPEAAQWLSIGLRLLRRELKEQVLPDRGHFERSPMYHAIVLSDLLDLTQLATIYSDVLPYKNVKAWRGEIPRMLRWLAVMTHPDGGIALFNDTALGTAPRLFDLEAGARELGIAFDTRLSTPLYELPESGYVRLQKGPAVLITDVGNIGPDYLPGHGHADTLSFEMSLYGQRVIVDTGTSRYDVSDERLVQRGTRAHNTVQVDEEDSSEVWSSFRVARRAMPFDKTIREEAGFLTIECAHDGYKRLRGQPLHRRQWSIGDNRLQVRDRIEGRFSMAVARFYFHPDITVVEDEKNGTGILRLPKGEEVIWHVKGGCQSVLSSNYHPEFGLSMPNQYLEVVLNHNEAEVEFSWS